MKSLTRLAALLSFLDLTTAQTDDIRIGLPPSLRVGSMSFYGTGCEDGTRASVMLNEQNQIVIHTIYLASMKGTGIPISEATKICTIDIKFRYNRGEQFAVYSQKIQGSLVLKKGMEATQDTLVQYQSFGGLTNAGLVCIPFLFIGAAVLTCRKQHFTRHWPKAQFDITNNLDRVMAQDFTQDLTNTQSIPWSSCNGEENLRIVVNAELVGDAGYTGGYTGQTANLGVDDTNFTMMWKKCSSPSVVPGTMGTGPGQINPLSGAINGQVGEGPGYSGEGYKNTPSYSSVPPSWSNVSPSSSSVLPSWSSVRDDTKSGGWTTQARGW
jgi:hypothetical protein